jgi:hypothetical protein
MTTIRPELPLTHDQRTEQILAIVRAQVETVEGFGHPPPDQRRKIAGYNANITDAELDAAVMACDANPELAAAASITGDEIRDGITFCTANTKLMRELQLEAAGVGHAVKLKRAVLANRVRLVYQVAQALNKPLDVRVPHIERLRAVFSRPRKRTAKPDAPAAPPPSEG